MNATYARSIIEHSARVSINHLCKVDTKKSNYAVGVHRRSIWAATRTILVEKTKQNNNTHRAVGMRSNINLI